MATQIQLMFSYVNIYLHNVEFAYTFTLGVIFIIGCNTEVMEKMK